MWKRPLAILIALLPATLTLPANADIFVVALPLYPTWTNNPNSYSGTLDLGLPLQSIQSATLHVRGEMYAGTDDAGGPLPGRFLSIISDTSAGSQMTVTPHSGASTWPQPELFESWTTYSPLSGKTLDFLLDGRSNWYIDFDYYIHVGGSGNRGQPHGSITFAEIIIDATPIPEPASAFLLIFGSTLLVKRPTRQQRPQRGHGL